MSMMLLQHVGVRKLIYIYIVHDCTFLLVSSQFIAFYVECAFYGKILSCVIHLLDTNFCVSVVS